MESVRFPRFKRSPEISPIELTERDRKIIRLVHQHRFLRSSHVTALLGESRQQVLRRLQLLYHHGYLERPRAQIDYYHRGGSRQMVYGLGNNGAALLKREFTVPFRQLEWGAHDRSVTRLFLEHALLLSDVMIAIELACRQSGRIRLLLGDESLPPAQASRRDPFRWSVNVSSHLKLGLVPDQAFALEPADAPGNRAYFFLEADRGTMPIERVSLAQSSFYRKLLAYEATWAQNLHRQRFGFHRFRVLTVTNSADRARHLADAAKRLERGRGLFLFTDAQSLLAKTPFSPIWQSVNSSGPTSLLN